MPRFAGTPVDQEPKRPRFGGVPVEQPAQVGKSGVTREQRQADIARMDAERAQRDAEINAQTGRARAVNLTGRGILEGVVAIPDMVVSPLVELFNRATEKSPTPSSLITGQRERYVPAQMNLTQGVNYLADLLGGERVRPETGGERVMQDTVRGLAGSATPIGIGRQMATSGNQVVNAIGRLLQQQPVAQTVGGGLSGAASGTVREAGGGTGAQLTAGFLGALAPFGPGALVRPNSTMVERQAMNQIRSEAANPASIALAERSQVPGVQRTLAEATLDPGIARMERQVRGRTSEFVPLDSANNAARVAQLQRIAGTDADMAAALQARGTATDQLRDAAFNEADQIAAQAYQYGATPGGNIAGLRQQIMALAGPQGGRDAVSRTFDAVLRDLDRAEPSAQGLYQVRKSINDMIEGTAGSDRDFARASGAELMQMRNLVDAELANLAPSFETYRGAFQNMSRPINRMEVGRELLKRGSGAVADPNTGLRPLLPASLSRQTVDLDALAQRATGFDNARAADILTPDDIGAIRAIQDDMERQNFRATAGSGGNSMTPERQALGERLGRSALEAVPVVGNFAERLRALNQPRIDAAIARLIANPLEARRVLESLAPRDRQVITKAMIQMSAPRQQEQQ